MNHPLVLAITGASGVLHALRLLGVLLESACDVHLTISPSGKEVLRHELDIVVDLDRFQAASLTKSSFCAVAEKRTEMQNAVAGILSGLERALKTGDDAGTLCYHHHADFTAPIASGSCVTAGMVICPCSGSTLSAVVHGASNNLVQRAADVHLKERRRLILVPRETPLSSIQLDNMKQASEAGAVVLPAMPGWYLGVRSIRDLIDFVVARILDQLKIEHALIRRWGEV
jgi:4-hydroxy-3-polyprenylbenzoate decarboxylase